MTTSNGFVAPNTTPVPDIVFDKLLKELTGNELKVLLYIIRRTYGFGKNADAISLSQFREGIKTKDEKVLDQGCGVEHNRTILVALTSLEKKGYVISNKSQTNRGDADTTVYRLRFKESPQVQSSNGVVTSGNHVVTSSNDGSYPTSRRSLPQVTTVVTSGNTQETVLQDTDKQDTVLQEERDVATATARSQSSHSLQEIQDDETVKREAVKPSQKDGTHGTSADTTPGGTAMGNTRAAAGIRNKRENTNTVGSPPAPDKSQTNQITPTPHAKPVEPHADMQWGTRKCLQWFDYWRGGILIAKYKLMEASRCAKGLAEQFDEATVIQIRERMAQDAFWMERGGPDVCDVANNIHKELNKKSTKATGKNEKDGYRRISSFDDPNFTMEHEFYPSEKEKREYYAAQAAQQGVKA